MSPEKSIYLQTSRYKAQPDSQRLGTNSSHDLNQVTAELPGSQVALAALTDSIRNYTARWPGHLWTSPCAYQRLVIWIGSSFFFRMIASSIIRCKSGYIIQVVLICNQTPIDFSGKYPSSPHRISKLQKKKPNQTRPPKKHKCECLNPTDLSQSCERIKRGRAGPLASVVSCPAQPISCILSSALLYN